MFFGYTRCLQAETELQALSCQPLYLKLDYTLDLPSLRVGLHLSVRVDVLSYCLLTRKGGYWGVH